MDATAGGSVMNKTVEEACDLYEEMAMSHYQAHSNRNIGRRVAGILEVDQLSAIQTQLASITNQLSNQKGPTMGQVATMQSQPDQIQQPKEQFVVEDVQFVGNRNYQFRPNNNLPAHYHPGLRNHENFYYSNTRNTLNVPPLGFQGQSSSNYNAPVEKRASTLEDNINAFVSKSRKRMDVYDKRFNSLETHCVNIGATIKNTGNPDRSISIGSSGTIFKDIP